MHGHFQKGDSHKIQQAVEKAELRTRGDIVPMVVHRSANLSSIFAELFLVIYVVVLVLGTPVVMEELELNFNVFALIAAVLSIGTAFVLSKLEAVQRFMTPKTLLSHETHTRAELEFYRNHFDQTKEHGAVLIFVSMMERRVIVLCDQFLAQKVNQSRWDSIAESLSKALGQGMLLQGLIQAIEQTGQVLAEVLPASGTQEHQISNEFRIKE